MTEPITSRHNARVKQAAKLRDRRGREEQGRIIIDGVREITRAVHAGVKLNEVFVCEATLQPAGSQLLTSLTASDCDIVPVSSAVFDKLSFGDRVEGLIAVATPPAASLSGLELRERMLVAVLEHVEKPGNIGAVLRSADAAGVAAVIIADGGTDLYNPNAIRASAGTIFALPLIASSSRETVAWLREQSFQVCATRVHGAVTYTSVDYSGRCAIVLGSEADGLSDLWQGADVTSVLLPMCGVGDSLNVSVTAAVLFYEALRQRTLGGG